MKYVKEISSKITKSLLPYKLEEEALFDIKLCVEEAVRNAIVHGNRSNRKLPVKVDCRVDDGILNIEVEDRGAGFDHKLLPDPTKDGNILRNSGRGVYLILKLMDKVEFNESGNRIRMIKRFRTLDA
ncbi:MAG: ATP-binding protein [Candidatus Omnitrophica bacterium]|nr:ATP-binding protein [Candidatus Omnitrophota bacterium]